MRKKLALLSRQIRIVSMACMLMPMAAVHALEKQIVAGAGPSTVVVSEFFKVFSQIDKAKDYTFEVPPRSVKHAGGIEASGKYLFGRTGRPLHDKELQKNKAEIHLARIPLAFVTGKAVNVNTLSKQQLKDILTGVVTNWKDVGGPDAGIVLVGREKKEASLTVLRKVFPFIDQAKFSEIITRDHRVVNFLKSQLGDYAIAFGAKPNFDGLNVLTIEGVQPGIKVGLVYDLKNSDHPIIPAVKQYVMSDTWNGIVKRMGYLAP